MAEIYENELELPDRAIEAWTELAEPGAERGRWSPSSRRKAVTTWDHAHEQFVSTSLADSSSSCSRAWHLPAPLERR